MQFLLDVIEIFLPEVSRAMSGPACLPLRRRLLRAGIGFFVIIVGYMSARLLWAVMVARQDLSPDIFLFSEKILLAILFLSGVLCVLLSRSEGPKGTGKGKGDSIGQIRSHAESDHAVKGDAPAGSLVPGSSPGEEAFAVDELVGRGVDGTGGVIQSGRLALSVATVFDSRQASSFWRQSGLPWTAIREAFKGIRPLEVWRIDVNGVALEFSFHAGVESLRVREVGQDSGVSCMLLPDEKPGMLLRLVDPEGRVHDLDVFPQKSLRHPLLVFLDGFPLALVAR